MANLEISQKSLERVACLCRNTIVNKIINGAKYGAAAYIFKPATMGDLELSSPQCLLLSLVVSLVRGEVMSCCMLADLSYQIQQFQSDHLRVWLVGDFIFPRQDMEKAMALLSKLLATGVLKLPTSVIRIMSSLAENYRIHYAQLTSPSEEIQGDWPNQLENTVINRSGDIAAGGEDVNRSTQSGAGSAAWANSSPNIGLLNSINTTPLEEAIRNDSIPAVKNLLKAGAEVNKRFFGGDTYLHIAAAGGLNGALETLLDAGLNINEQNYLGETSLVQAVRGGNVEGVGLLLKKGANIGLLPEGGQSLIEMIVESQNVNMFKEFVRDRKNLKFKDGDSIFHLVARSGNEEMLEIIRDWQFSNNIKDLEGLTPLHVTSDPSAVKILIEIGIRVNEKNKKGETALHLASVKGSLELVKALVQQGANVNAQDENGTTAMMVASTKSKYDIVTFLLHCGANPNMKDKKGRAPIHYAAENGCIASVQTLLDAGARVDEKDGNEDTPAHLAAANNKPMVLKLLAELRADLTLIERFGKEILHHAASNGYVDVVKVVLDSGVDVNMKDKFGYTALYGAAEEGHVTVVSVLLDYGAYPGFKRKEDDYTPLMAASSWGRLDVVQLLIARGAWVNARNTKGQTALYFANECRYGIVADYLKSKVDISSTRVPNFKKIGDGEAQACVDLTWNDPVLKYGVLEILVQQSG